MIVHLVVGPDEHGVVRHGLEIAAACGHDVVRTVDDLPVDATVVHVPFTDRLFGATAEDAGDALCALAAHIAGLGASLSVTLHDVPHDRSPLQRRRRAVYERVIGLVRGVVVNSHTELGLVQDTCAGVHSLRAIPLPVYEAALPEVPVAAGTVAVLGFVFPDRGYEQVLAALPPEASLTAIGRAADGHGDLLARYAATGRWHATGYVPDADLPAHLAAAAVPIAPNRRVTASASINTWIGHGRRPLVPDSPYAREIAAARPGTVTVYDPHRLAEAIAAAVADPASTWLPDGIVRGPAPSEVAATYREHLAACAPPRADGGLVPDNRWDLLAGTPAGSVSVVVPYYDAQRELDLVLTMLAAQHHRPDEIVVVDDGSPEPPDVSCAGPIPTTVLRQDDLGFRAARARNLGAAAASGDVLVFLDGDTVPEPGFVAALTRLPRLSPDAVTVGRRRHAELVDVPAERIADVLANGPTELPEPQWLVDAYRGSADLLHADRRSYRHVISAVLAVPAALFHCVGGFDERFVGYGGEDWDLAHRLRTAGALLAHVPDAVAWHDGPDWAARHDPATRLRAKNAETAALAVLLPDPDARGVGVGRAYPSVVVTAAAMPAVDALAVVRSAAGADCAFWFDELTGAHRDLIPTEPGVRVGTPPSDVLARAWCHGRLHAPARLDDLMPLAESAERHGRIDTPALTLRATRAISRAARWSADADLLFGRHDRTSPAPEPVDDLAGWLSR